MNEIVANFTDFGIPLDGIWSDTEYMDSLRTFTLDQSSDFGQINSTLSEWRKSGVHWVPTVMPWFVQDDSWNLYKALSQAGAVNKDTQNPEIGQFKDTEGIYVDFWSEEGAQVWRNGLSHFYNSMCSFDGLSLSYNEPVNWETTNATSLIYGNLYLIPGNRSLSQGSLNIDCFMLTNYRENDSQHVYDLHQMYGIKMTQATHDWMNDITQPFIRLNQRPFLFSRSTFPGSGKFGGHFSEHNLSSWEHLKLSISSILNMNLFGITLTGVPVCGEIGDTTDDLCARWYQLAAFYPFMRNHNSNQSRLQDPWSFPLTLQAARSATLQRYSWLVTLYQLFIKSSTLGGPVAVPTFFNFPDDRTNLIDNQHSQDSFMWLDKLLILPCLLPNRSSSDYFNGYLPKGVWYNATNSEFAQIISDGQLIQLPASYEFTNLFIPGGQIVHYQNLTDKFMSSVSSVGELVGEPVVILIAPDQYGYARGQFQIDDGFSLENSQLKEYRIHYQNKTLRIDCISGCENTTYLGWQTATAIKVLGEASAIDNLEVCARYINMTEAKLKVSVQANNVVVTTIDRSPLEFLSLRFITFFQSGVDANPCKTQLTGEQPEIIDNGAGVRMLLNIGATQTKFYKTLQNLGVQNNTGYHSYLPPTNPDQLMFTALLYNTTRMNKNNTVYKIKIEDPKNRRFQVPLSTENSLLPLSTQQLYDHGFSINSLPYSFEIRNPNNLTQVYITTKDQLLVFQDRFIELDLDVASNGKYWGLGDRAPYTFFLRPGVYTSYARNFHTMYQTGQPPSKGLYGVHPVLFTRLVDKKFMAIFVNNANAQDWILDESSSLGLLSKFITIGGIIEMYVILGTQIQEVVRSYHEIVGRPVLVPLYAFGYHQCRWGYTSLNQIKDVYEDSTQLNFPLDGIWADIDLSQDYINFSVDQTRYEGLAEFINEILKPKGVHFIPIVNPTIFINATDSLFVEGFEKEAYIMSGYTGEALIGQSWSGKVVFLNHFPNTPGNEIWQKQFIKFRNIVPFDGVWLDKNEASQFCDGECGINQSFTVQDPVDEYGLIYEPGMRVLIQKSLSYNAYMTDQTGNQFTQYDMHSLYGFLQMKATSQIFTQTFGLRPFILSRSTYAGSGRWASHWLGDNYSTWISMQTSIIQIMYFNMYGIPLVGADVCGFEGDAEQELCDRWMQLGAFYPFMRNHNSYQYRGQAPWEFDGPHLTLSRQATLLRYSLLRYIYSIYYDIHVNGGTLFRPLFFEWPQNEDLYNNPQHQFLIGNALMIVPVLHGFNQTNGYIGIYFPISGAWVNLADDDVVNIEGAQYQTQTVQRRDYFAYQVPGTIIPFQDIRGKQDFTQTSKMQTLLTGLRISLDLDGYARGSIILDDGVSLSQEYWKVEIVYKKNKMKFEMAHGQEFDYQGEDGYLGNIMIQGYNVAAGLPIVLIYVVPKIGSKHTIPLSANFYKDFLTLSYSGANNPVKLSQIDKIEFITQI